MVQTITKQIDKLAGRKQTIPDQLAGVRSDLEGARAALGAAQLDGKPTEKLRAAVADLMAQEAGLVAAIDSANGRLQGLKDDLNEAERAELVAAFVEADKRLGDQAEVILGQLFDILDWSKATILEIEGLQQRARQYPDLEIGPTDLQPIHKTSTEIFQLVRVVVKSVCFRFSIGGHPARFANLAKRRFDF